MKTREMPEKTAVITNIQRFSLDDGDGIRSTVFFKGCPLHCVWCHNPECINPKPELQFIQANCVRCNRCVNACPNNVFSAANRIIARENCSVCGKCVAVCPQAALKICGKEYTVGEIIREVAPDINFYRNSGGGVTLSGGEPLSQNQVVVELLRRLRAMNISTALDTCGCIPVERLRETVNYTDVYLLDIKTFSPALHKRLTGMDNRLAMQTLNLLTELDASIYIRIPLVAAINDSLDEIEQTAKLLSGNRCVKLVELLAYHAFGASKYATLGREYPGKNFQAPSAGHLQRLAECFSARGLTVRIKLH
jgi:pyruvate formate lyase activating enzyme